MIPVQRPYLDKEEATAVEEVMQSGWLGMGAVTEEFEKALKEFLNADYVTAVNTGTSALHLALDALELKPDDEVIVPSLTFAASPQAILASGAKPVFCEVSPNTLNIDPNDVVKKITDKTRVIMPVHFGGTPCELDEIMSIAQERNIRVIEDAAHAFGSKYNGKLIGSSGDITCFSFDPIKNITCGEGGAVITSDKELSEKIKNKRILGISKDTWGRLNGKHSWFYDVLSPGYRYHMSNINAAIGLEQLKKFEMFKRWKKEIAARYNQAFQNLNGIRLREDNLNDTFPFFYVLRVLNNRRNEMMEYLKNRGIVTGLHYIPNHLHTLFYDSDISLPVTESLYEEIITLPLYYEMTEEDVEKVISTVTSFFQ